MLFFSPPTDSISHPTVIAELLTALQIALLRNEVFVNNDIAEGFKQNLNCIRETLNVKRRTL